MRNMNREYNNPDKKRMIRQTDRLTRAPRMEGKARGGSGGRKKAR